MAAHSTHGDGLRVVDDWCLELPNCDAVGRIYKVRGGPCDGHWFWAVQIDEHFWPWNGGSGCCETGREAKEAVEARVPKLLTLPKANLACGVR